MKKEKKINREKKPGERFGKYFNLPNLMWGAVVCTTAVFTFTYGGVFITDAKIDAMTKLNEEMKLAVQEPYEDKDIRISDIRFAFLSKNDKQELAASLKSLVEQNYYEFADSVYDSTLRFEPFAIEYNLDAQYKDVEVHKSLGIEDYKALPKDEYIEAVTKYLRENFKYKVREKINIPTFIDEKIGQCYSYSELFYLLGKERNMNIRIELNGYHSWNSYEDDNEKKIEFDATTNMEVIRDEK